MKPEHKKLFESLTDWQLLGLCIEREASGEPYEGKVAVGTIVLERVDHREWDGKTLHEVILAPWQFSWTMPQAGEDYYNQAVWMASNWVDAFRKSSVLQECCGIATGLLNHSIPRDGDLKDCFQYLNPKVAGDTKKKWLASGMKSIKRISHHEFFK
jgi:hypothetical protein